MIRKAAFTLILLIFLILSAACSNTPAGGTQQEGPDAASGAAVEVTDATVTAIAAGSENSSNTVAVGLEQVFEGVMKIDILYHQEWEAWNGSKPVVLKDAKIISDISDMVTQSKELADSPAGTMSGMASKNTMVLYYADGNKHEISFFYDDPAFARGYLELNGKIYDPGYSFFRYLDDFSEYTQFDTVIDKNAGELFRKYGWTVDYRIKAYKVTLPENFRHDAGEYPIKLYWAYNKELSKSIGLDYSSYSGKNIEAELFRLREPLPDFLKPRMDARGIILKYDGKIIGAYIDSGRHDSFACSLDRKSLKDVSGKEWNGWVADHINLDNELEKRLSKMKPEEVVALYYDAMDRHDEKTLFACMTRRTACGYLAMNMDNNLLYNEGYSSAYVDGESNVKSVKLIKTEEMKEIENRAGTIEFAVTVDYQFKKEITASSGEQPRFLILQKESETAGWRISSEGTGP